MGMPQEADASLARKRVNVLGAPNYGTNTLVHALHDGSVTREHVRPRWPLNLRRRLSELQSIQSQNEGLFFPV
jgi:hypothetical protein